MLFNLCLYRKSPSWDSIERTGLIILLMMAFINPAHASSQDNKNDSEEEYIVDEGFDGKILWGIFDESHIPASKEVEPPSRAKIKHQKRYMLNFHIGRRRSDNWLFGIGGELKLGNIVFPITLASTLNVTKGSSDRKGLLSLGTSLHFPGNLLSSNVGTGTVRNVFADDKMSYYGLFGIELLNIIYGEYQAIRERSDLFRFGLRFFM